MPIKCHHRKDTNPLLRKRWLSGQQLIYNTHIDHNHYIHIKDALLQLDTLADHNVLVVMCAKNFIDVNCRVFSSKLQASAHLRFFQMMLHTLKWGWQGVKMTFRVWCNCLFEHHSKHFSAIIMIIMKEK